MKKIYKPLILLTAMISLSFSVEASEPAKKVNLSINNIIGTYSVNNKETTNANSETAAAALSLDTSKGLYLYDKSGNVYYQDTDGQSYIDGLAPNHYAYDKNGAQMNSLYVVRDKYIVKVKPRMTKVTRFFVKADGFNHGFLLAHFMASDYLSSVQSSRSNLSH